jgi:hypothetical protein
MPVEEGAKPCVAVWQTGANYFYKLQKVKPEMPVRWEV